MDMIATLDLDDLTPKQLRKMLHGLARGQKPHHEKSEKEKDEDKEKAAKDNDSLVDLDREKGDSKPPKVNQDDLPPELSDSKKKKKDDDEEDDD